MAPLDHAIIYPADPSSLARASVAPVSSHRHQTDNSLSHGTGRILAIVFCAIFVGVIILTCIRGICEGAGCCTTSRHADAAADDDDTNAAGSEGEGMPPGAEDVTSWEDIEPVWGEDPLVGAAAVPPRRNGGRRRRSRVARPLPTVPRPRSRDGWKTPPPAYTPPPSYDSLTPVGSLDALAELQVPAPAARGV